MGSATTTPVPPLTAHLTSQPPTSGAPHVDLAEANLSRDHVPLLPKVWELIDRAVAHEVHRTRKATKVLPQIRAPHHATNVEQNVVLQNLNVGAAAFIPPMAALGLGPVVTPPVLNVYEAGSMVMLELSLKWALTRQQVQKENQRLQGKSGAAGAPPEHSDHEEHLEEHHPSSTAVMLARLAANTLVLGVDALTCIGSNALTQPPPANAPAGTPPGIPLFSSQTVVSNGTPADAGLTCIGGPNIPLEVLTVQPANAVAAGEAIPALYSVNTVARISQAVTDLAANGYGGPHVALLPPYFFAESFFPLGVTLQRPADIILTLLEAGYYDSVVMPGVANPVTPNPGVIL